MTLLRFNRESWKSNRISEENIKNITKSDSNFPPTFVDHYLLRDGNFNGYCLIKNNISIPKKVINLYVSYALRLQLKNLNTYFTLGSCLFGSVKLAKNVDRDKYKYTCYSIGFDPRSEFLFIDGSYGKMSFFRSDMSSSVHVDNKRKKFVEGPTQGLDDTTLKTEAKYPINFTQSGKRFVLSLHYNESNSFLFVNAIIVCEFKANNSEIKDYALCLGNVSKDFAINNMKKTGLKGLTIFKISINIRWK